MMFSSLSVIKAFLLAVLIVSVSDAFSPTTIGNNISIRNHHDRSSTSTSLLMAKKIRNKQAELMKKMAEAKKQNQDPSKPRQEAAPSQKKMTDQEIKEQNDRRRFEELLKSRAVSMNDISSDGYLSKGQEEAEIDAYRKYYTFCLNLVSECCWRAAQNSSFLFTTEKGADRLFEGDPAPTEPFEGLVNAKSDNVLGDGGTKRVVPWLSTKSSDYVVVICDPRMKSTELREAVQSMSNQLPKPILSRTIVINADTPSENRRWCKKSGLGSTISQNIYSDEKKEWMRAYTALGEKRWSMTMFVLADERIQKIAREMEALSACKTVLNAVKSVEAQRL